MERLANYRLLFVFLSLLFAIVASASPQGTTYQARIVKPDGLPLESANVNFKFTVLDPAAACILYAETFSAINMSNSGGVISFTLGSGVKGFPASATTFAQVFNNSTSALTCDAGGPGTYTPLSTDVRKVVMQFNDGAGWQTLPAMSINAVPYSIYSGDSLRLGGVGATSYVQYSTIPTCTASQAIRYDGSSFSCLTLASGGGAITSGDVTTALGYTPANLSTVSTSFTTVTNSLMTVGTSFSTVTSTLTSLGSSVTAVTTSVGSLSASHAALAASVASMTSSQWTSSGGAVFYNSGNVGIGTSNPAYTLDLEATGNAQLALRSHISGGGNGSFVRLNFSRGTAAAPTIVNSGDRMGALIYGGFTGSGSTYATAARIDGLVDGTPSATSMPGHLSFWTTPSGTTTAVERMRISSSGTIGINTSTPVTALDVSGGLRIGMETTSCGVSLAGTLRYTSGNVEFCNGSTWSAFSTGNVTSSSVVTALGYTPADNLTVATSFTAITATVNTLTGNIATVSSAVTNLSASVSAITSSQWISSGTTITYASGSVRVTGGNLYLPDGTTTYPSMSFLNASGTGFSQSSNQIEVSTGGVQRMQFNAIGITGSSVGNPLFNTSGAGATTPPYSFVGDSQTGMYRIGAGLLGLAVTGSEKMRIDASGTVGIGGNVVLGSIPNYTNGGTGLYLSNEAGDAKNFFRIDAYADDLAFIGSSLAGASQGTTLSFNTITAGGGINAATRMRIAADGNVGIGTTNPTALLHLAAGTSSTSTFKFTSGTLVTSPQAGAIEYDGANLYYTDGASTRRTIAAMAQAGNYDNVSVVANSTGNIALYPNAGTGVVTVSATTASTNSQTGALVVKGGVGVTGNIFASGTIITSNNIQGASITALGDVYVGSRLGIGTTAPQYYFDLVKPTGATQGHISGSGGDDGLYMMGLASGGWLSGNASFNGANWVAKAATAQIVAMGGANNNVAFYNDSGLTSGATYTPSPRMIISSSGSVIIGGTSGTERLHVNGNVKFGSEYNQIIFPDPGAANAGMYGGISGDDYSYKRLSLYHKHSIAFATDTATPNYLNTRMYINASGAVGVGTVTPQTLLDVSGAIRISDDQTACSSGNKGAMRFAQATNFFELCDGISWNAVANADLVPASTVVLMHTCPTGWANNGLVPIGGPGAVSCGGLTCSLCQATNASLIPANSKLLVDFCPTGWTNLGKAGGPGASGYTVGGNVVDFTSCQSPAASTPLPKGVRMPMPSCPALWPDLGGTALGPTLANCSAGVSCRVCETPGGTTSSRVLYGGLVSATLTGPDVSVIGGSSNEGSGGDVNIFGGSATTTTNTNYNGGAVTITGGRSIVSGTAGAVTINGGSAATGVYGNVVLATVGRVGIGVANPNQKLEVSGTTNLGSALATNISDYASGGIRLSSPIANYSQEAIAYTSGGGGGAAMVFKRGASYDTAIDFYTNNTTATTGAVTHAATINNLGYLGVGTSTPTSTVHAVNAAVTPSAVATLETTGAGGRPYLKFRADGTDMGYVGYGSTAQPNLVLMNYVSGPIYVGTDSMIRMTITSAGAMGIGTQTPLAKLDVIGDLRVSGGYLGQFATDNFQVRNNYNPATDRLIDTSKSARALAFGNGNDSYTFFRAPATAGVPSWAAQFTITSGGAIGIGTATPAQLLDVEGYAQVNYLKIDAADGVSEGGEIQLVGAGANGNIQLDNLSGNFRVHTLASGRQMQILNGAVFADSTTAYNHMGSRLGIGPGTTSPAYTLDVNGDARATGAVTAWSDVRTKKNIKVIPDSLQKILQIRGVTFDWRLDEFPDKRFKQTRDMGVIAQEIEKVFPEVVQTDKDSYKSVGYAQLVAPLIEAVKALYYKITGIERKVDRTVAEVDALKAENTELKQRLDRLEKMMFKQQNSK